MKNSFPNLIETVRRLRAPGGCPWDREQTHQSLRPYLIEEAYEALEIMDQIKDDKESLKHEETRSSFVEELGDVLMQVMIHSEIAEENGHFNIHDVVDRLNHKLIIRHPHVFEGEKAENATEALANWEKRKAEEKAKKKTDGSVLSGLPKNLPALQRSARMCEKVSKVGFRWENPGQALEKVKEEIAELDVEIKKKDRTRIQEELGDALFSICSLASQFDLHPEDALRAANERFENRFRLLEGKVKNQSKKFDDFSEKELIELWNQAKS